MQDPKFEKQVKQKMEELSFPPSAAVWAKVDAEINKDRKRRRPLLWLFFFLGLSLAGGAYFITIHSKSSLPVSPSIHANQATPEIKKSDDKKIATNSSTTTAKQPIESKEQPNANLSTIAKLQKNKQEKTGLSYAELTQKQKAGVAKGSAIKYQQPQKRVASKRPENSTEDGYVKNKKQPDSKEAVLLQESIAGIQNKNEDTTAGTQHALTDSSVKNKPVVAIVNTMTSKDSSKKSPVRKNSKSTWQVGFVTGGGISGVRENFKAAGNLPASATGGITPGNPYRYIPSSIRSGFSFEAGLVLRKPIGKRMAFLTGLNYRYYSTEIKTGVYINGLAYVSSYNLSAFPANGYYQNSNSGVRSYVNKYHFVEIPAGLSLQLLRVKEMPVNLELGFSIAYLAGTNALQFDPSSGVYYKNNSAFQKFQVNGFESIMISFPVHGLQVQAGPQFQYAATNLLRKNAYDHQQLFFIGAKLIVMPARKK